MRISRSLRVGNDAFRKSSEKNGKCTRQSASLSCPNQFLSALFRSPPSVNYNCCPFFFLLPARKRERHCMRTASSARLCRGATERARVYIYNIHILNERSYLLNESNGAPIRDISGRAARPFSVFLSAADSIREKKGRVMWLYAGRRGILQRESWSVVLFFRVLCFSLC